LKPTEDAASPHATPSRRHLTHGSFLDEDPQED
jgi:hypothetical protein